MPSLRLGRCRRCNCWAASFDTGVLQALGLSGRGCDEGAAALACDDQSALPQDLHRVPDCLVRDAVLLCQGAFGRQLVADIAHLDPRGDVIGHLDVGEVRAEWIYHRHVINVGTLLAA